MKKIVVLGPESTGKSFLSQQLATHYKTQWVPEYAREYLQKNGTDYVYEDLYEIAMGQVDSEENIVRSWQLSDGSPDSFWVPPVSKKRPNLQPSTFNLQPLFLDTDLYTIKIWSEISFNSCDNRILTQIAKRRYDVYLLCNTDLPWAPDPLREYPDLRSRQKIYNYYKDVLVNQEMPWVDISGNYEERFLKAVEAVNRIIGY